MLVVLAACEVSPKNTLFTLGEARKAEDSKAALELTVETQIDPEVLVPGKSVTITFPIPEKTIKLDLKPASAESLTLPKG